MRSSIIQGTSPQILSPIVRLLNALGLTNSLVPHVHANASPGLSIMQEIRDQCFRARLILPLFRGHRNDNMVGADDRELRIESTPVEALEALLV